MIVSWLGWTGDDDPGPLRFSPRDHTVEVDPRVCDEGCNFQENVGCGDARLDPTPRHMAAEQARSGRTAVSRGIRMGRRLDDLLWGLRRALGKLVAG